MSSSADYSPTSESNSLVKPLEQPLATKKMASENSKKPVPNKLNTEKSNKSSNMTVVTETVDTSSINILPISHEVIPKNLVKGEDTIDDSNETFLYDNSLQGQLNQLLLQQVPQQLQQVLSGTQQPQQQQIQLLLQPDQRNINPQGISNTNTVITTPLNTGSVNTAGPNASQPFMKNGAGMKKPRFTQRNGSFHSTSQTGLSVIPSAESESPQNVQTAASANSINESSTDFTLSNNNTLADKYSDNEDDGFESSTYETRSQNSMTNKSSISPKAAKHQPNRRVASMKPPQTNNWVSSLKNKPYSTLPPSTSDEVPPLRTITSKLFDSKGTLPRRYSGLPPDIDFDDFDDDEFDDYRFDFNGSSRLGDDEAEVGGGGGDEYKNMRLGKKHNYGSINDELGSGFSNVNGFNLNRLKKFKKNNGLYYSPHDFPNSKNKWRQISNFCYTFLLIVALLFVGFISGFLLASTKDLQAVRIIDATEIIISQEELVFNLIVDGFNPGFINIEITDVEIEVFAKSSHVHDGDYYRKFSEGGIFETVLLGSITELEIPLKFQGGFFTRQKNIAISEIKILNPCSNDPEEPSSSSSSSTTSTATTSTTVTTTTATPDNREVHYLKDGERPPSPGLDKWHSISQHPFDLIIRGVLKYNLPILNEYKTVGVNKVVMVDPDNLSL